MTFDLNKNKERLTEKANTLTLVNNLLKDTVPVTHDMITILENLIELDQNNSKELELSLAAMTLRTNIDVIFEQAVSPIEKIFTNCLNLIAFMDKKILIQFTPPITKYHEISYAIEKRKEIVQRWIKFRERIGGPSLRYFFLDENVSKSNMNEAIISLLIHYVDKMYGIYFVSLQTIFNDITVEGMSIRPDLFIFTPFNLDFKVIVECDGYDYHSNRHKFSDDRKRDRYLIREGFKVLRFSGTEINKQTLQSTQELYDYLVKQKDE